MKQNTYSVAFTEEIHQGLVNHLNRPDGQEDLCFALYNPSSGHQRFSALIFKILLPNKDEHQVHGNASFNPSYFERALDEALKHNCGLALLHSHPEAVTWQTLSGPDYSAETELGSAIYSATNLPLAGLTLSGNSLFWSARLWFKTRPKTWEPHDCETVRVIGQNLKPSYCPRLKPEINFGDELNRTIHAWGEELQQNLSRLRIGIVGLGSVGQMIAECLSRMGMSNLVFIDFDNIEKYNLDRTLHAYSEHAETKQSKAILAELNSYRSATSPKFSAQHVMKGIHHIDGYEKALDCDVIFSGVDKPLGRSIINFISYAHLIPVIDGGIDCSQKSDGNIRSADWGVFTVGPNKKCLACHEQYNPGHVGLERDGLLEDPSYISSLPENSPLKKRANVFPFSMALASLEVQKLIHLVSKLGFSPADMERYSFPSSDSETKNYSSCKPNCSFSKIVAQGDTANKPELVV